MEQNIKKIHHRKINISRNKIKTNTFSSTKSINSITSQINISKYKLINCSSYNEITNTLNRPTISEIKKKILLPKIDDKNHKFSIKIRKNEINNINRTPNLETRKFNRYINLYNNQVYKSINKSYIEITKNNNNLRIKNFNQVKKKLLNNNHENKVKNNFNIKENNKNHDFEKKTILIQKMLRGSITRKKYEAKLTDIKNKNNKNNNLIKSTNIRKDKIKTKNKTKSKSKKKVKSKNNLKNKNKIKGLNKDNSKQKTINCLTISSDISKVSINSEDLNFSDEESDDINEDDLPSDID